MTSVAEKTMKSPLERLSEQELEKLAKELDAIHDEVFADLGERDRRYIKTVISVQRQIVVAGRILLLGSRSKTAWILGTACLGMAKILENMEIGHNVMHGQWDWMNDPDIHSSVWDWDTASTAEAWKHSHNYIHHTYTNILGKDKDLGYELLRIDPAQKWAPRYLFQPISNLLLTLLFEWGVAIHDMDIEAIRRREKPWSEVRKDLRGISGKARAQVIKDYLGWPLISAGAFALVQLAARGRLDQPPRSRVGKALRRAGGGRLGSAADLLDKVLPGWKAPISGPWAPTRWPTSSAMCGRTPSSSAAIFPTRPTLSPPKRSRTRRAAGGMCANWSAPPTSKAARCSMSSAATSATRWNTTSIPTCRAAATRRSRRRSKTSANATNCRTTPAASRSSG